MRAKTILFVVVITILAGCVHYNEAIVDNTKRKPTQTVEFFQGTFPTNNYHCIAMLTAHGDTKDELTAVNYFMGEAKHLGGDAVVMEWPTKRRGMYRAAVVTWSDKQEERIKF